MYIGYILIVVDTIAAIFGVLGLFGLKMDPNRGPRGRKHQHQQKLGEAALSIEEDPFAPEKMFSQGQMILAQLVDITECVGLAIMGFYMVRATKLVIRQLSSQEMNPNSPVDKHVEEVRGYERKIAFIILMYIVIEGVTQIYWFFTIDSYLESTFDTDYKKLKELAGGEDNSTTDHLKVLIEEEQMDNIDHMQQVMTVYGPIAIILSMFISIGCCSSVFCCFTQFRKNL